jgi:hypothetical protein
MEKPHGGNSIYKIFYPAAIWTIFEGYPRISIAYRYLTLGSVGFGISTPT